MESSYCLDKKLIYITHNICIGQQQSDLRMEGGEVIKQCTEYKYLEMKINTEGTYNSEINYTRQLCHIDTEQCIMVQECYKRKEKIFIIQ
jgi:hypothetical protein